ncbi:MAG: rhodanese-like domain-containing protein [bacterium]|nr:rhodanese-like domain-containing protein [bacterium]
MKKFLWQSFIIIGLSFSISLAYNQFSENPLPVFEKYDAHKMALTINKSPDTKEVIQLDEIDAETLQALVESESAILLDARIGADFQKGHIPGARSFPISAFEETYESFVPLLNEGKTIIIYCAGIQCTDSSLLGQKLHDKGYNEIFIYKGGMEEWMEFGYPVNEPEERDLGMDNGVDKGVEQNEG